MYRLPRWTELKSDFPAIAEIFWKEYHRVNGFIPYEHGFVYAIHAVGSQYVKIGKSINPDRRLLQIAPQMPFRTRFIKVWRTSFMSMAEVSLHRHHEQARTNGEWFELDLLSLGVLLDEYTERRVRYCYADSLDIQSIQASKPEWHEFCKRYNDGFSPMLIGAESICRIQSIFDGITEQLSPGIPPDLKTVIDATYEQDFEYVSGEWGIQQ